MINVSWKAVRLLGLIPVIAALVLAQHAEARVRSVTISGDAEVGLRLRAVVKPPGSRAPRFQWLRCAAELPRSCGEEIAGATRSSYVVDAADVGHRLAVRAKRGAARRVSDPTRVVPAPYAIPGAPEFLQPFPVVRMKGRLVRRGARITRLRVSAPRGARIRVRCAGPTCPLRRCTVRRGPDQGARALPARADPGHDPRHQGRVHREVRAHHDPRRARPGAPRRVPPPRPEAAQELSVAVSQRLWMLPIAACLAALLVTLLARGGDPTAPAPAERSAQLAAPRAEPAAAPAPVRLALADVRDIPAPLATPQPRRVAPPAPAAVPARAGGTRPGARSGARRRRPRSSHRTRRPRPPPHRPRRSRRRPSTTRARGPGSTTPERSRERVAVAASACRRGDARRRGERRRVRNRPGAGGLTGAHR